MTLIYLRSGDQVLLLKRNTTKKVQAGKLLGLGGKIECGEDVLDSAVREFQEESGLRLLDPKLRGTQMWLIDGKEGGVLYIIAATQYEGTLLETTDEGELEWHAISTLANLQDFAVHQYQFIDHILDDTRDLYAGIAIYEEGKEVRYIDSTPYFAERAS